jgi:hypothetical protein
VVNDSACVATPLALGMMSEVVVAYLLPMAVVAAQGRAWSIVRMGFAVVLLGLLEVVVAQAACFGTMRTEGLGAGRSWFCGHSPMPTRRAIPHNGGEGEWTVTPGGLMVMVSGIWSYVKRLMPFQIDNCLELSIDRACCRVCRSQVVRVLFDVQLQDGQVGVSQETLESQQIGSSAKHLKSECASEGME